MIHYTTYRRLQEASADALVAHYANGDAFHVNNAREHLIDALAGLEAGTRFSVCRSTLIDLIAMAIVDADAAGKWSKDAAEDVLAAILNKCLPMPEGAE